MVILYFSDCDPSGWNMPISLTRKLQALRVIEFPDMEFQVHRVALTPDHVRAYALPSTPLKDSERRADKWKAAMGVEQTEIDALLALRPRLLRELAETAIAPFYDSTLHSRVRTAKAEWLSAAQAVIDENSSSDELESLREAAAEQLEDKRTEIEEILDSIRVDAGRVRSAGSARCAGSPTGRGSA